METRDILRQIVDRVRRVADPRRIVSVRQSSPVRGSGEQRFRYSRCAVFFNSTNQVVRQSVQPYGSDVCCTFDKVSVRGVSVLKTSGEFDTFVNLR